MIAKKIILKKVFKVFMSENFNEREEGREMTEICLIQKDATIGKPIKIFIDRFFDITTVIYFKKYNPQCRIEELLITFHAMRDYRDNKSALDGVSYGQMEYPDIFTSLKPNYLHI